MTVVEGRNALSMSDFHLESVVRHLRVRHARNIITQEVMRDEIAEMEEKLGTKRTQRTLGKESLIRKHFLSER